jgi:UDP-GlcNAc:undecaprenyl-phosphate GlcNAc-1-phosphate transferase
MMDVWSVTFIVALLATLSGTQMVRVTALRLRAVDSPGGRRVHRRTTPRLGGLGIFWGFAGSLLLVIYGNPEWRHVLAGKELGLLGILGGAGLMLVVGLLDDLHGLAATVKLGVQIGAAVLLWGCGWRVEFLGLPGFEAWPVGAFSLPLTVGWVVLVTNALNLIDGLDGLAGGVALIASVAACFILPPEATLARVTALALTGALLGFLWFNFNPALIFMGDTGSLFVGFVLSAITLRIGQVSSQESFPLVPALLLAVPLTDTVYAIVRRTLRAARQARSPGQFLHGVRTSLFAPDRGHVHHLLLEAGFSTRRAVALLWGTGALFAISGWLFALHSPAGLSLVAVLVVAWGQGFARVQRRARAVVERAVAHKPARVEADAAA